MKNERYVMFKMRLEAAESLLHSLIYHKNLLEAHGHRLTGTYPKFIGELHGLIQKKKEEYRWGKGNA